MRAIALIKGLAVAAALLVAALTVPAACSGTQERADVVETLEELQAAVSTARDALEAARPILEAAGDTDAERLAVTRALDSMEGVLELGEALAAHFSRATERGGWAWASAILGAIASVLDLLKGFGVPIPDAVTTAAGAADLLLPALAAPET